MILRFCLAALAAVALPVSAVAQLGPPQERYIVVLNEGLDLPEDVAADVAIRTGGRVGYVYEHALRGFSIIMPRAAIAAIQRDPRVNYVEEDRPVRLFDQDTPTGIQRIFADDNFNIGIDGSDDYRVDVDVAVIDTGIDFQHPDLNVVGGIDCSGGGPFNARCKSGGDDDHFHGTHVAGTIGALDNGIGVVGVAPGARLWAVKVLGSNGSAWTAQIVAGIDWVAANAETVEVANMSLGGSGYSQAEYDAIQGAVNAGVAFAVAAGNDNDDANNYSPAAFDNVLTVSALADFDGATGGFGASTCRDDQDDTLADFSNWGSAVQIAAPGVCIHSTYPIEQGEYGTISGTSMASPHVAGALALLASANNPSNATDVSSLYDQIINAGNDNWTDDSGDGTPEPLLDVSNTTLFNPVLIPGGGEDGDTNTTPVANDDAYSTAFETQFTVDAPGVLGNDDDTENDPLTASLVSGPANGALSLSSGGSFTYTPGTGFSGDDTFAYVANDGTVDSNEATVTITVKNDTSGGGGFTLTATGYKVKGLQKADLSWDGAGSTNIDVYRDGGVIATTANDSAHTDNIDQRGGGSYTYQVCEEGTSTCSGEATVTF